MAITAHPDGTTSIEIDDDELIRGLLDGTKRQFNLVLSPKLLHMMGRFLGKVGLGLLAISERDRAYETRFDQMRKYARYGRFDGLWPIFSYTSGGLGEWRRPTLFGPEGETLLEDVALYSYELNEAQRKYTLFRFSMGVDNWIICLDDPYPSPEIRTAFPNQDLKLIWYSPGELSSNNA